MERLFLTRRQVSGEQPNRKDHRAQSARAAHPRTSCRTEPQQARQKRRTALTGGHGSPASSSPERKGCRAHPVSGQAVTCREEPPWQAMQKRRIALRVEPLLIRDGVA